MRWPFYVSECEMCRDISFTLSFANTLFVPQRHQVFSKKTSNGAQPASVKILRFRASGPLRTPEYIFTLWCIVE